MSIQYKLKKKNCISEIKVNSVLQKKNKVSIVFILFKYSKSFSKLKTQSTAYFKLVIAASVYTQREEEDEI